MNPLDPRVPRIAFGLGNMLRRPPRVLSSLLAAAGEVPGGIARLMAAPMAPRIARIPITNALNGFDYTARIAIGSGDAMADVILDTGSSALAVLPTVYDGSDDAHLKATAVAQSAHYGLGGWGGPMVTTRVGFGPDITLPSTRIAICSVSDVGWFKQATGIMGLAYNGLNAAYDLTPYFTHAQQPAATWHWPFPEEDFPTFDSGFKQLRKTYGIHSQHVAPYFDDLESSGVVANKFAFHTLRSCVSKRGGTDVAIAADPLNHGVFVLGGGEEQDDLYEGGFVDVNVHDDLYYNANLKAVQVDGCDAIAVQPLQQQYVASYKTNCIIDSGTSVLWLAADVHAAVLGALRQCDPAFGAAIDAFTAAAKQNQGLPMGQLDLARWPAIHFVLEGPDGEDVRLACAPQTYWQVDHPEAGQANFQIIGPLEGQATNQSVLGLPLLNNYYTVFDRSASTYGLVRFARIRRPEGC